MTLHDSPSVPDRVEAPAEIRSWRRRELIDAGFPASVADMVVAEPRFDLHALLQLVDRGCSPELAVRILAPMSREVAP